MLTWIKCHSVWKLFLFFIASFQRLLFAHLSGHSMFQDDGQLSTSPNLRQAQSENVEESFETIQNKKENPPLMQRMRMQKSRVETLTMLHGPPQSATTWTCCGNI